MSEVRKYSTKRKETPFEIDDKPYILRELSGTDRDHYLNAMTPKMRLASDGKQATIKDFTGLHSSLIHLCLFGPDGEKIPESTIQSWPASLQADLFEEANLLSGLDKKAKEEAKND